MARLLFLTLALAITGMAEEIKDCASKPYYPSKYTCYDGFLCPVINGEPTLKCDQACYLPEQYDCVNGKLTPPSTTPPPPPPPTETNVFSIHAIRTVGELQGKVINACGSKFYLGPNNNTPCTYCPDVAAGTGECADLTNTTLIADGSSLFASVPGGQQIYVDPAYKDESGKAQIPGRLGFTQANSAAQPPLASNKLSAKDVGMGFISYVYAGTGAVMPDGREGSTWVACPLGGGDWQIFARITGDNDTYEKEKCVGLEIETEWVDPKDGYGAWQYV